MAKKKKSAAARRAAAAVAPVSAAGRCYLNADRLVLGEQQLRQSVCPGCRWGYAELRRRRLAGLEGGGDTGLANWLGWLAGLCPECRGDLQAEWGAGVEAECGVRLGWHSRRWGEMESGVVSVVGMGVGMQGYRQTGADGRRGLPLVVKRAW